MNKPDAHYRERTQPTPRVRVRGRFPFFSSATTINILIVVTAALGIGNWLAVSCVSASLRVDASFQAPQRLLEISNVEQFAGIDSSTFYEAARQQQTFTELAEYLTEQANMSTASTKSMRVGVAEVSDRFFRVLDVEPAIGTLFESGDDQVNTMKKVVISRSLWKRYFHGSPSVLGTSIKLNGVPYSIVGVAPAHLAFPGRTDVWSPTIFSDGGFLRSTDVLNVKTIGRLKGPSSTTAAAQDLDLLYSRSHSGHRPPTADTPHVQRLDLAILAQQQPILLLLRSLALIFSAFILILLLYLSSLLRFAATDPDYPENTVRRSHPPVLQAALSTIGLTLVSLTGGVLLSPLLVATLDKLLLPADQITNSVESFQWLSVGYAGLCVLITLLVGISPDMVAREDAKKTRSSQKSRYISLMSRRLVLPTIVAIEFAIACFFVTAFSGAYASLNRLSSTMFRFESKHLATFSVAPLGATRPKKSQLDQYYGMLTAGLQMLPNVRAVGYTTHALVPDGQVDILPISLDGLHTRMRSISLHIVSSGFFGALGLNAAAGAFPTDEDLAGPRIAVVSTSLAKELWQETNVIGKTFSLPLYGSGTFRVVAVLNDLHPATEHSTWPAELFIFCRQVYCANAHFVVRTTDRPTSSLASIGDVTRHVALDVPLYELETLDDAIARGSEPVYDETTLLAFYTGVAFALGAATLWFGIRSGTATITGNEDILPIWNVNLITISGGLIGGCLLSLVWTRYVFRSYTLSESSIFATLGISCAIMFLAITAAMVMRRRMVAEK